MCGTLAAVAALALAGAGVGAQVTIQGVVRSSEGDPVEAAQVSVEALAIATLSSPQGAYVLVIPEGAGGGELALTVRQVGYKPASTSIRLEPGGTVEHDFVLDVDPFLLESVIVVGQGLEAERTTVGSTINTVRAEEIRESDEPNVVNALAGKAPNVEVTSSTGDPGGGAYIRIRGTRSIVGGTQPLIVVDGTPINNESRAQDSPYEPLAGAAFQNRAADLNTADIESIEILKGAAASGIYGSRAANGVILITTREGARNATRWTLTSSLGLDHVTQLPALQTRFGQGLDETVIGGAGISTQGFAGAVSYGAELADTVPVFDHAGELFGTGTRSNHVLTLEGGGEATTYYLSLGHAFQDGVIKGNSSFERTTARLKASRDFGRSVRVTGSVAYTAAAGDLVEQGSTVSGLLLGALRTPPEFDNCLPDVDPCYVNPETGLHRSYRFPDLTVDTLSRAYDNPFWVANEILNTTDVDRVFGNISVEFEPRRSLSFRYLLGADFSNDQRTTVLPRSSSDYPQGRIRRQELVDDILDQSVLLTLSRELSPSFGATLTVGQNLNRTKFRELSIDGYGLLPGVTHLDFASLLFAREFESTVKTEGYLAEATLDAWDELHLRGGVRADAASTFGGDLRPDGSREGNRYWYPTASVAWDFGRHLDPLDFGKLRVGFGVAGVQPPPYSNATGYESLGVLEGLQMIGSPFERGDPNIEPERTRELEVGAEVSFADDRVALGLTRYWQKTSDAILPVQLPPETGFYSTVRNGASWRNWGWEATLDVIALRTPWAKWNVGVQWGRNRSMVDELGGAEWARLGGFYGGSQVMSAVAEGYPLPVLVGGDFVRFGRGTVVDGVSIDSAYSGWKPGDLYIDTDGFPEPEIVDRVIGDPNPDWTGSIRNTVTFFDRLTASALVDVKWGGQMWNGTREALMTFGTHASSERFHGEGVDTVFAGIGPGAGTRVPLNWDTWTGIGRPAGFGGVASLYVEDAGFVKLREVSLSTSWHGAWLERMGFGPVDVTLSGRNLLTWTDYTGIDPESNLTGQTAARGLDYFNNPQTRSFLLTITLRR